MNKCNAFSPDYVRTYMPDLMPEIRLQSRQTKNGQNMANYVEKVRKTKPSHGTVFGISNKVLSLAPAPMMKGKKK